MGLSRAIAIAQHEGPARGLDAIAAIDNADRLEAYPFYAAAQGELELRMGRPQRAQEHFRTALGLARSDDERRFLEQRLAASERVPKREGQAD